MTVTPDEKWATMRAEVVDRRDAADGLRAEAHNAGLRDLLSERVYAYDTILELMDRLQ